VSNNYSLRVWQNLGFSPPNVATWFESPHRLMYKTSL